MMGIPFRFLDMCRLFLSIIFLASCLSCSVKKDKLLNRTYHGITARYNKFYNAEVLFDQALEQYQNSIQEDYGSILNVRKLGTKEEAFNLYTPMETVIKKNTEVVQRHSMKFRSKEKNPWIDETFILLGKAHFYKQDYESASVVFNHASNFKLLDEHVSAKIWAAEAQMMMGNYFIAERALTDIVEEEVLKNKHKIHILEARTELYKRQDRLAEAVESLEKTIKYLSNGNHKTRNLFIIGQLFFENDEPALANEYFQEVERSGNDYIYVFNALLYQAKSFDPASGRPDDILLGLDELAEEPKNQDYLDQIYFAKAQLFELVDDPILALENYQLALDNDKGNDKQLIRTHLAKGTLEFDEQHYAQAQVHYDEVMNLISEKHPDYQQIKYKQSALGDLAELYETIDWTDSLLIVSDWDAAAQLNYAKGVIKQEIADSLRVVEIEKAKQEAINKALEDAQKSENGTGSWYFANPSLIEKGKKRFTDVWGFRIFEENWRRKNKEELTDEEIDREEIKSETSTLSDSVATDSLALIQVQIDNILAQIPKTESEKRFLEQKLSELHYQLGLVYKEQLLDYEQAKVEFEKTLAKFDEFERKPACYYQLYRLYTINKNNKKANYYKNLILDEYASSDFAALILERKNASQKEKDELLYESAYELYKTQQFNALLSACDTFLATKKTSKLTPRFYLMKAEALVRIEGREAYVEALEAVVSHFPETPEETRASYLLAALNSDDALFNLSAYNQSIEENFYLVFLVNNDAVATLNQTIGNFKNQVFSKENLAVNSLIYSDDLSMISLKVFSDFSTTIEFIKALKVTSEFKEKADQIQSIFPISFSNYPVFYKRKNSEEYQAFYSKYLEQYAE